MRHGKEIYLFFNIYGVNGVIGIIISQSLIGIIIYKVIIITKKYSLNTYSEFIDHITYNHKINETIKIIINIFLLITFYIMIAGFSAYFSQELGVSSIIGTAIILVLCYIILMGNIESVTKLNTILIPILIIYIILLTTRDIEIIENINEKMIDSNFEKSIYKAILYSSYNSITLIPIVISIKEYVKSKSDALKVSILSVILLTILSMSVYNLILKIDVNINMVELPTVYVARKSGEIHKYIYGIVILVAIFTSAVSIGYSLLKQYEDKPKKYKSVLIVLCISSIFVSKIGFSNLINLLYPIFGLLGLVQILLIVKNKY